MASDREEAVSHKTFWTVCSALALLTVGSFGHSQYLDSQQTAEKRDWRQDFKGDIRRSIDGVTDSVKDLKQEQRQQAERIREDTQRIQDSINRLLADQHDQHDQQRRK